MSKIKRRKKVENIIVHGLKCKEIILILFALSSPIIKQSFYSDLLEIKLFTLTFHIQRALVDDNCSIYIVVKVVKSLLGETADCRAMCRLLE